jgi:hypothetical protein
MIICEIVKKIFYLSVFFCGRENYTKVNCLEKDLCESGGEELFVKNFDASNGGGK